MIHKKSKCLTFIVIFYFFNLYLLASEFKEFDVYQKVYDKNYLKERIEKYLLKNPENSSFVRFSDDALLILDGKENIDYKLLFGDKTSIKKDKKIVKKIAIDPGHLGGEFAEIEGRYVGSPKKFDEGTLTFLTGLYLKELLEKEGFIVMMTRASIGSGAYPLGFHQWLELNPELKNTTKSHAQLFKDHYNSLDLEERAKIINEFEPDLTIIIHYNASEEDTHDNFNLVHVPGCFRNNELATKACRKHFLRLLLTDNLDHSITLSDHIIKAQTKQTKVLPVNASKNISYLKNACLEVSEGVWARNLRLTRLVKSPLCYGETLLQNNYATMQKLMINDDFIQGIACPSLIKDIAFGYYQGIMEFYLISQQ